MGRLGKWCVLCLVMLFFVAPVFAQEGTAEETVPDKDVVAAEDTDEGVVTGNIVSLNADLGTITIKTADGAQKTFSVIGEETILWRGIEDVTLADVKAGEEAEVGYYSDESGKFIASWIDIMIKEEPTTSSEPEPVLSPEAAPEVAPEVAPDVETEENPEE